MKPSGQAGIRTVARGELLWHVRVGPGLAKGRESKGNIHALKSCKAERKIPKDDN